MKWITPSPEPLEARIAPAILLHYTDVDGDAVTVKISKGTAADVTILHPAVGGTPGEMLSVISLAGNPLFDGANISVTAKPQRVAGVPLGDGHVNVGYINAAGVNLGTVKIQGDLGALDAGSGQANVTAVKSLSVASLGAHGTSTGAPDLESQIEGTLGALIVTGSVDGAFVRVGSGGNLGSVTVGGSIRGAVAEDSGEIFAEGNVGPVVVGGDVVGGIATASGSIGAGKKMGSVTIGGSVIGNGGEISGRIYSGLLGPGDMGPVKIGHDLRGGSPRLGSDGHSSGTINVQGHLASVTIGGSVIGGRSDGSGEIVADSITKLTIRGSLLGGEGEISGAVRTSGAIGTIIIKGSIAGNDSASGTGSGAIVATVGAIGKLSVGGSIAGGGADGSGSVTATASIGSVTVGGDVLGGGGEGSGGLGSKVIGIVGIGGSLIGGSGDSSGGISGALGIDQVTIGGSLIGGALSDSSGLISAEIGRIGNVTIGGDLRGGDAPIGAAVAHEDAGEIQGKSIGRVVIRGSILTGVGDFPTLRGGSIIADEDIGSIVVKGSIVGRNASKVTIMAGGKDVMGASTDVALKSLTVGGDVAFAQMLFGYDRDFQGVNSDAQVGTVKVGGDWIASYLIASVDPVSGGIVGDGNDTRLLIRDDAPISQIASIVIGGQVIAQPGTTNVFGFAAEEVRAMTVGGVKIPLLAGAGNDTFAAGKAHSLGSSLSPSTASKPDAYAVHVFEV